MAVKGKKKSQSRGSQGRRRPAEMPRPGAASARIPFHQMREGRIALAVILALVVGILWYALAAAQSRREELQAAETTLGDYTGRVDALLQNLTPSASAMTALTTLPTGKDLTALGEDAERWVTDLTAAQAQVAQLSPSPDLEPANQAFSQSVQLYLNAANAFALVPTAEGKLASDLFTTATGIRDQAAAAWSTGVAVLDQQRRDADLDPSGLRDPGTAPVPVQTTTPESSPPASPSPEGTGGDG